MTELNENNLKDYIKNVFWTVWWKSIQVPLFAWIISGENILLFWETGSNKTWFVENFAKILDLNFRLYTTPKTTLEDIVPFFKDEKWNIKPIDTLTSIWNADLVFLDELNRVPPHEQWMFFEVLRWKSIKWIPLNKLKWIFSAVNPEDYGWTYSFDAATANRFSIIINIPNIWQFEKDDIKSVWKIKNSFDNRSVNFFYPEFKNKTSLDSISDDTKKEFVSLLKDMTWYYISLYDNDFLLWEKFIDVLVALIQKLRELKEQEYKNQNYIEWRKMSIFKKNLLSCFSSWYYLYFKEHNKKLFNLNVFKKELFKILEWSNTQKILWNKEFGETLKSFEEEISRKIFNDYIYTEINLNKKSYIEILKIPYSFWDENKIDLVQLKEKILVISKSWKINYEDIQLINFIPLLLKNDKKYVELIVWIFNRYFQEISLFKNEKYKVLYHKLLSTNNVLEQLIWFNYYFFIRYYINDDKEKETYYKEIIENYDNYKEYFKLKLEYVKNSFEDFEIK